MDYDLFLLKEMGKYKTAILNLWQAILLFLHRVNILGLSTKIKKNL